MIKLSQEQEKRARKLHFSNFILDYNPFGEPFIMTSRSREKMIKALKEYKSPSEVRYIMAKDRLIELVEDPEALSKTRNIWKDSGVNAVLVTLGSMEVNFKDWDAIIRDIARWYRRAKIDNNMAICTSTEDLKKSYRQGRVGLLLGLQDTLPLGKNLDRLEVLYHFGVRFIQLTYNTRNLVGDGCLEQEQSGLTPFGIEVVNRMNKLNILVDVSHSGYKTTIDAIETSTKPVAFTHISCKSIYDHPRAKSDEELRLLAKTGGFVGILAAPHFLKSGGQAGVEDIIRHLAHCVDIVGLDRVGIATDWAFWSSDLPNELREGALEELHKLGYKPEVHGNKIGVGCGEFYHWTDWYQITRGLVAFGYSDNEIKGFLGNNQLNFLKKILLE